MRYDLTVPIRDLNGVQLTDDKDTVGYTLRSVLIRTALHMGPGKAPSPADKLAAYALAKRIALANHFMELTAAQVVFLKDNAGALWPPLVMGQLWELLESPLTALPLIPTEAPPWMDPAKIWPPPDGYDGGKEPDQPVADIPFHP